MGIHVLGCPDRDNINPKNACCWVKSIHVNLNPIIDMHTFWAFTTPRSSIQNGFVKKDQALMCTLQYIPIYSNGIVSIRLIKNEIFDSLYDLTKTLTRWEGEGAS